jgi:CRP/FNR family transcriptional regulator
MAAAGCPECATDLARVPLFEHLSPNDLVRLAAVVRRRHFPREAVIFLHGQRADGVYILLDGLVKLYRTSPDGRQQTLHLVVPPSAFAEAAVFAGGAYPAHAMALRHSECLFLPRDELIEQVKKYPEMSMRLLASMSMRLQHFVHLIEDLSLREVSARLARYLVEESQRLGRAKFRLAMSKGELARQLGTTPETISRTFTRFREEGLLDTSGKLVHLLNAERLEEFLQA